ncbi:3-keto-5-aminohexanoate cleavage protein [Reyranella sp.]|uniref:3-keto-5-aminohexanoate cleavage protein n=1 Tax=Reyranella sp. TaxID=1929291 RepID=UPI003BA8F3F5
MEKLIIEARVNEYATRTRNRNVPWLSAEIAADAIECRQAGASIVHFHGRDATGAPDNRFETCRDTILAIRASSDILIHPSLGYVTVASSFEERFGTVRRLSLEGATRPEIAPMDMGSVNVDLCDRASRFLRLPGSTYVNPTGMLVDLAKNFRAAGIKPSLVAWNVSFLRLIEAFRDGALLEGRLLVSLVLTDRIMIAGHPGTEQGLDAYLMFLPRDGSVLWAVTYIGGRLDALLDKIILAGGHVQIGLGDYPYVEDGCPRNAQLVEWVAERARALGRDIASPDEVRAMLGLRPRQPAAA